MKTSQKISNKKLLIFTLIVILVGSGIAVKVIYSKKTPSKSNFGRVERGDIRQTTSLTGNIATIKRSDMIPPYTGYVKKIYVHIGQKIAKGDPVVSVTQSLQTDESPYPIRSPIDGIVTQVNKAEGEHVTTEAIVRIEDRSTLLLKGNVSEVDRIRLKKNIPAEIRISSIPNKTFKGHITELFLSPLDAKDSWLSNKSIEYPIIIQLDETSDEIQAGMTGFADILLKSVTDVLTLRHEYIYQTSTENYVIMKDGQRRNVQIGERNSEVAEIKSGLSEKDEVQLVDYSKMPE